jgi:hypothetical protein
MLKLFFSLVVGLVLLFAKLYAAIAIAVIGGIISLLVAAASAAAGRRRSAGDKPVVIKWD